MYIIYYFIQEDLKIQISKLDKLVYGKIRISNIKSI